MTGRRESPAALRNREPIREVLAAWVPERGRVLEVPCGSGVHAAYLSRAFPALTWIPADIDPAALRSTAAWRDEGGPGMEPPVRLDVRERPWPIAPVDVVFCANLIHIAPPEVTDALLAGAAEVLVPGGVLVLYGPFLEGGTAAPSNLAFDASLRARDPSWGLRDLERVTERAAEVGLDRVARVEMPANNLTVVFVRGASPHPGVLG